MSVGSTNPRTAGPSDRLQLAEPTQRTVYDVVGEHRGRWAQIRTSLATAEQVRAEVDNSRRTNPSITWHVIARTTTITEHIADDVLNDSSPTEADRDRSRRTADPAS